MARLKSVNPAGVESTKRGGDPSPEIEHDPEDVVGEALQAFSHQLTTTLRERVSQKRPIEERWAESLRQMAGRYGPEERRNLVDRSQAYANLTAPRTLRVAARIIDTLSAGNAKNWELKPEPDLTMSLVGGADMPVAEVTGQSHPDPETGEEQKVSDVVGVIAEEEKIAARGMSEQIWQYLKHCSYPKHLRQAVMDMCIYGSGIIRGPVEIGKTKIEWVPAKGGAKSARDLKYTKSITPSAIRINPWLFYPDLSVYELPDCADMWELQLLSKKQATKLQHSDGVIKSQLRKAIEQGPQIERNASLLDTLIAEISDVQVTSSNRYELWIYNGPITQQDLQAVVGALGKAQHKDANDFRELLSEDPLEEEQGIIWFLNERVIKVDINPLQTGEFLYDVVPWERDDTCIFGRGIPEKMRDTQSIANSAWRMVMDNGSLTTVPQFVIDEELIEPEDGKWDIIPGKIWRLSQSGMDARMALQTVELPSHLDAMLNIFQRARELMDEESRSSHIDTGGPGAVPQQTAHGMSVITAEMNVHVRHGVRQVDDYITAPLIKRMYHFEMQFGQREEIKGNFSVDPVGASVLFEREHRAPTLMALAQMVDHPVYGPMIKPSETLRVAIEAHNVRPELIMYSEEEIERNQAEAESAAAEQEPEQDPQVQVAQIRAETDIQIEQMKQEFSQQKLQNDLAIEQMRQEANAQRLAHEKDVTLERLKGDMGKAVVSFQGKRSLMEDEREIKERHGSGI